MKLICPASACRAGNHAQAEVCERCGTPLRGYARLSTYPARLFNLGLSAARAGKVARARDFFAAVVHWCPMDLEARNALAMACFALGDETEARHHWEMILERSPVDALVMQGLAALESATKVRKTDVAKQHTKARSKKKRSHVGRRRRRR